MVNCKYFRFHPLELDTLVYSNEEEDENSKYSRNNSKSISKHVQKDIADEVGINLGSHSYRRGKESGSSHKNHERDVSPVQHEPTDVLSGKDLDTVSPLIKRLLIDTYTNHTRQRKSKHKKSSRNIKKAHPHTLDEVSEHARSSISKTGFARWKNAVGHPAGSDVSSNISRKYKRLDGGSSQINCEIQTHGDAKLPNLPLLKHKKLFRQKSKSLEELGGSIPRLRNSPPLMFKV